MGGGRGRGGREGAAMHRLVLGARESPGTISVFEGADEAVAVRSVEPAAKTEKLESPVAADELSVMPPIAPPLIDEAQSSGGASASEAPIATGPDGMI